MKKKSLLLFILFSFFSFYTFSQQRTIEGVVSNEESQRLPGASVVLKGKNVGTISNVDGNFSLNAATGDILVVSFIGYHAQEIVVDSRNTYNFVLLPDQKQLSEIVVLGTRRTDRTITESAVPIDIISSKDIAMSGFTQTVELLQNLVPSYNAAKNSLNDGTDHVRPASLRGLGPEHVLLLVNGKRRHISAIVHLNDQNRGAVGVDLNTIPPSSIERIEVLRDGASSQYGSDAIAGVINIVLKKSTDLEVSLTYGQNLSMEERGYDAGEGLLDGETNEAYNGQNYYLRNWATTKENVFHTDGGSLIAHIGKGFQFGKTILHVSAQYRSQEKSNRSGLDPRYNYFVGTGAGGTITLNGDTAIKNATTTLVLDPREAGFDRNNHWYGRSKVSDINFFFNGETKVGASNKIYYFGGVGYRESLGPCYFRRANDNRTVRAIYPDGFLPQISPIILDLSVGVGYKGKLGDNWTIDVSEVIGRNSFNFRVVNTHNTSLGDFGMVKDANGNDLQKKQYDDGTLSFLQSTTNVDLVRQFDVGFSSPLNLAMGLEYRYENYEIQPGELGSYINGNDEKYKTDFPEAAGVTGTSTGILDGPNKGTAASAGCQCFPGYNQNNKSNGSRSNIGLYVDLETDLFDALTIGLAGRYEYYSDFGSTLNGKLSLRLGLFDDLLAIRTSVSTGFRAPALAQIYYSSIATVNLGNNQLGESGTFPVNNKVAQALGSQNLTAEKSFNVSAGIVFNKNNFTLSVDGYYIDMRDRVILSENFTGKSETRTVDGKEVKVDLLEEFLISQNVSASAGRYFTNALDSRTMGLDITGRYLWQVNNDHALNFTLALNFNNTTITNKDAIGTPELLKAYSDQPLLGNFNRVRMEQYAPQNIQNLIIQWNFKKFALMLRSVRYGEVTSPEDNNSSNGKYDQVFSPKVIFSTEASYQIIEDKLTFAIGANNVLDTYPEKRYKGVSFHGIFPYSGAPPYGFTGRYVYVRAVFNLK